MDKAVLITGGAKRLGKGIALELAKSGYNLILHYHSSEQGAKQTQEEVDRHGVNCEIIQADLTNTDSILPFLDDVWQLSPLFAIIHNASLFKPVDFFNTSLDDWQTHFNIHATAPFIISRDFAKKLDGGNGRIINILDWQALRPNAERFAYMLSKSALAELTRIMAIALAPNITVNGIAPGAILKPSSGESAAEIDKVPLQRWGESSDISTTVKFLLEGPGYITGEIIHVDGGRHLI
jgi:pteridine reductase